MRQRLTAVVMLTTVSKDPHSRQPPPRAYPRKYKVKGGTRSADGIEPIGECISDGIGEGTSDGTVPGTSRGRMGNP